MQDFTKELHSTKLIIDRKALLNNVSVYRKHLSSSTKIMLMIKAFGYGNGDVALAKTLEEKGAVDYFGVAYVNEGIALREGGISLPIMVMNPGVIDLETALSFNLEITIHSPEQLSQLIKVNTQEIGSVKVHIKIDSGMHRLGFHYDEIRAIALRLKEFNIQVVGAYTHLASSPLPEHDGFTQQQFAYFDKCYELLSDTLDYRPNRHVLNSAGIIRFPERQYEMVRAGMGVYGVDPSALEQESFQLICRFMTRISQINNLNKGETVGYVRRGEIKEDNTRVAVLPVGYADGYNRLFSNGQACVYLNGHRAPVIGNVCMDMTFIDVTGIECAVGDEVELFGPNISIQELANAANSIDYEILTSIGARVVREYV